MNERVEFEHPYRTCVHGYDCDYQPCPLCTLLNAGRDTERDINRRASVRAQDLPPYLGYQSTEHAMGRREGYTEGYQAAMQHTLEHHLLLTAPPPILMCVQCHNHFLKPGRKMVEGDL